MVASSSLLEQDAHGEMTWSRIEIARMMVVSRRLEQAKNLAAKHVAPVKPAQLEAEQGGGPVPPSPLLETPHASPSTPATPTPRQQPPSGGRNETAREPTQCSALITPNAAAPARREDSGGGRPYPLGEIEEEEGEKLRLAWLHLSHCARQFPRQAVTSRFNAMAVLQAVANAADENVGHARQRLGGKQTRPPPPSAANDDDKDAAAHAAATSDAAAAAAAAALAAALVNAEEARANLACLVEAINHEAMAEIAMTFASGWERLVARRRAAEEELRERLAAGGRVSAMERRDYSLERTN